MAPAAEPAVESKRLVKLSVFFKKRADLTDEEFQRYWSDNHGPLFTSLACAQEKLVKYNQYHNSMSMRNTAASLGHPMLEFDGAAELWATDMDSLLALFQCREYMEIMIPDENKFIDRATGKFMFGYDDLKLDQT